MQKIDPEKFKAGLIKITGKVTLEELTEEEGVKILNMLYTKLESEKNTAKAEVDKALPPVNIVRPDLTGKDTISAEKRPYIQMAMACSTQVEAEEILRGMEEAIQSSAMIRAVQAILITRKFNV